MVTLNQAIRGKRIKKRKYIKFPNLYGCPQKKGECKKVYIVTPKKPNSALRKVVKVFIRNKNKEIIAYVPGENTNIKERDIVLFRGCNVKDLPGVKYKIILGAKDTDVVCSKLRKNKVSKYGVKKYMNK